jgi:hypothetical protein
MQVVQPVIYNLINCLAATNYQVQSIYTGKHNFSFNSFNLVSEKIFEKQPK